eukprot:GILI01012589.1.p1 GENE.GILI01012589.1~~GILI01012589.1.p1  ORF type:complete len:412 (-),score=99.99 GILI01012589.1:310-1545(-)
MSLSSIVEAAQSWDGVLVTISYFTAVTGAHTAIEILEDLRATKSRGWWWLQLFLVALSIGLCGIWSMHAIGMNSLTIDKVPVMKYKVILTFVSSLPAIAGVFFGILICVKPTFGKYYAPISSHRILVGGALCGVSVAGMHYSGMASNCFPGSMEYNYGVVAGATIIAVAVATVGLWIMFMCGGAEKRMFSAVIIGVAVCAMHYTGMQGMRYYPDVKASTDCGYTITGSEFGNFVWLLGLLADFMIRIFMNLKLQTERSELVAALMELKEFSKAHDCMHLFPEKWSQIIEKSYEDKMSILDLVKKTLGIKTNKVEQYRNSNRSFSMLHQSQYEKNAMIKKLQAEGTFATAFDKEVLTSTPGSIADPSPSTSSTASFDISASSGRRLKYEPLSDSPPVSARDVPDTAVLVSNL